MMGAFVLVILLIMFLIKGYQSIPWISIILLMMFLIEDWQSRGIIHRWQFTDCIRRVLGK